MSKFSKVATDGIAITAICASLGGCGLLPPGILTANRENAELVDGPPAERIITPFDPALACVKGKISQDMVFSVGAIADNTGKEQYADGGSGKYISQGAGDMVQSALFSAGLSVVNRRDPNVLLAESNWGLRQAADQTPSDFFITGSITSLDFIPGGGARLEIAGVGPRYRQSRILIGLDLALTAAATGRIVANSAVQKQLFAEELGFSTNRFVGDALLAVDAGGVEREAVHLALRQTLAYATLSLLTQVMPKASVETCAALVMENAVSGGPAELLAAAGDGSAFSDAKAAAAEAKAKAAAAPAAPTAQSGMPNPPAMGGAGQAPAQQGKSPPEATKLANSATSFAARAIAAADSVLQAKNKAEANAALDEAVQYMTLAIQTLREAATKGLVGAEGDATATLVENAIKAAEAAQKYVSEMPEATPAPMSPTPAPAAPTSSAPNPKDLEDKLLGGSN